MGRGKEKRRGMLSSINHHKKGGPRREKDGYFTLPERNPQSKMGKGGHKNNRKNPESAGGGGKSCLTRENLKIDKGALSLEKGVSLNWGKGSTERGGACHKGGAPVEGREALTIREGKSPLQIFGGERNLGSKKKGEKKLSLTSVEGKALKSKSRRKEWIDLLTRESSIKSWVKKYPYSRGEKGRGGMSHYHRETHTKRKVGRSGQEKKKLLISSEEKGLLLKCRNEVHREALARETGGRVSRRKNKLSCEVWRKGA